MKESVHPPETSSARPQVLFRALLPGFVLFSSPRRKTTTTTTKQIPTAGDELSKRRRGTRNERVSPRYLRDRGRVFSRRSFPGPVTIFPEFRSSNSRNAECAKNWRKTRAYGKRSRGMVRIFNSDSSPIRQRERERERESVFEEARV